MSEFTREFNELQRDIHINARDKGFWVGLSDLPLEHSALVKSALIMTELAEFVEAIRHGNPESDHVEGLDLASEELADVIIRVMDLAEFMALNIASAIEQKVAFNAGRPFMHGNKLV